MDQHDPRMSGAGGPDEGGRIRRPTRPNRGDDARLERLSAYLDGWTTDRERVAVERELAADHVSREVLDDLRLVRVALANLESHRAPRSFALAAAPARHRPFALFRRLEWATRGAAGLAALAFAFALVRAPQAAEPVTSTAVTVAQENAATVAAPVETQPAAKARETATQTLSVAPSPSPTSVSTTASAASAGAPAPVAAPATFAAPVPATAPSVAPSPASASATPGIAPRTLLAPAPAPSAPPAATSAAVTPAPPATVEATRLAAAPTPAPTVALPVVAAAPEPTATPEVRAAKSADSGVAAPAQAPAPGTTPPAVASDSAGATDVAPALGVLALLLVLLATIQRAGGPPHDEV